MPYKFSPSTLSILKECPRCFWLQFRKGIKRPAGIFPSLPSGMDRILKEHFDRFLERGMLPPELKEIEGEVQLFSDRALLEKWRNNFRGISWQDEEGNIFRGAVDNILVKGEKLIVLDYKTRGYPLKEDTASHYDDQLSIYNLLLRKNGYETEDYSYLLFYYPDTVNENGDIVFHTRLIKVEVRVENAERIFREAVELLRKEAMPDSSDECDYCRWASECSF